MKNTYKKYVKRGLIVIGVMLIAFEVAIGDYDGAMNVITWLKTILIAL